MSDAMTPGEGRGIGANSALMAAGTITSRITGMVRDVSLVAAIGTAVFADTYSVANTIPLIIYILIIGGALNAVFVPQLVRRMASDEDGGSGYADRLLTLTASVLAVLTVVVVLGAPWIISLYGSNSWSNTDMSVSIAFARYCLPQIFFFGVYTMLSQVLNARGSFGAPMFAPIVNNAVVIGTTITFIVTVGYGRTTATIEPEEIALLGLGTTAGVALQAAVLIPALRRAQYRWRLRFDWRGHGLGRAFALAKWTMLLVLVNQITYAAITKLATTANVIAREGDGVAIGFTSYLKAHLLFVLPHSVITVSIVTALLPRMSRAAHDGRLRDIAADVTSGARSIIALVVPAAAAFIVLGPVIGRLLYGHGASSQASGASIGEILAVFAIGLPAFSVYYVLLRGFYSLEDTKTPFLIAVVLNVVNLVGAIVLFHLLDDGIKVHGLAAAYVLAYVAGTGVSWWVLSRRLGGLAGRDTLMATLKMIAAAAMAAGLVWFVIRLLAPMLPTTASLLTDALTVAVSGVVLLVIYLGLSRVFNVAEVRTGMEMVKRKLRG
jgi:putative peptidoglycan lipid II flippase